ncbi:hypothetical protein ABZ912_42535 [Nonomuraea angiospora]|uniref:hypothetical protein n=1 Tax=Nonomuraea angiospora TaxID=46172 RepID=UPI0033C4398E
MTYKRKKTFLLKWDDGEFEGLEVRVRSISVRRFLQLGPLLEASFSDGFSEKDIAEMEALFREFSQTLVSWNLADEDTDEPVPCTFDAFMDQDIAFVKEIISSWAEHIAGVAAPLEQPSPGGEPFPEESLPMETLSPSLAS